MNNVCCVESCRVSSNEVKLYCFPSKNPILFEEWIKNVGNAKLSRASYNSIVRYFRVCQRHFKARYIEGDRGLLPGAVPTLFTKDEIEMETIIKKKFHIPEHYYCNRGRKQYSTGSSRRTISGPSSSQSIIYAVGVKTDDPKQGPEPASSEPPDDSDNKSNQTEIIDITDAPKLLSILNDLNKPNENVSPDCQAQSKPLKIAIRKVNPGSVTALKSIQLLKVNSLNKNDSSSSERSGADTALTTTKPQKDNVQKSNKTMESTLKPQRNNVQKLNTSIQKNNSLLKQKEATAQTKETTSRNDDSYHDGCISDADTSLPVKSKKDVELGEVFCFNSDESDVDDYPAPTPDRGFYVMVPDSLTDKSGSKNPDSTHESLDYDTNNAQNNKIDPLNELNNSGDLSLKNKSFLINAQKLNKTSLVKVEEETQKNETLNKTYFKIPSSKSDVFSRNAQKLNAKNEVNTYELSLNGKYYVKPVYSKSKQKADHRSMSMVQISEDPFPIDTETEITDDIPQQKDPIEIAAKFKIEMDGNEVKVIETSEETPSNNQELLSTVKSELVYSPKSNIQPIDTRSSSSESDFPSLCSSENCIIHPSSKNGIPTEFIVTNNGKRFKIMHSSLLNLHSGANKSASSPISQTDARKAPLSFNEIPKHNEFQIESWNVPSLPVVNFIDKCHEEINRIPDKNISASNKCKLDKLGIDNTSPRSQLKSRNLHSCKNVLAFISDVVGAMNASDAGNNKLNNKLVELNNINTKQKQRIRELKEQAEILLKNEKNTLSPPTNNTTEIIPSLRNLLLDHDYF